MRLLYLTSAPMTLQGHSALTGRRLFDAWAAHADDSLLSHCVAAPGDERDLRMDAVDKDVVTSSTFDRFDPDVVFLEGGLVGGVSGWRLPEGLFGQVARRGGVVFVADVEWNAASQEGAEYDRAYEDRLLGGRLHRVGEPGDLSPVYGLDLNTGQREFTIDPAKMPVDEWLRPAYEGVESIHVVSPVEQMGYTDVAAISDPAVSGTLIRDVFLLERGAMCAFATVRQVGDGYVVFISGVVSHDAVTAEHPGNILWLLKLADLLRAESAADVRRYSRLRALQNSFAELPTVSEEQQATEQNRILEREQQLILRRESSKTARERLEALLGAAWTKTPERVQQALVLGEVLRQDAELLADDGDEVDFALAVAAYSRGLEMLVLDLFFLPYAASDTDNRLPPTSNPAEERSVDVLEQLVDRDRMPTLGSMAQVLKRVGWTLKDSVPNDFAAFLDGHLASSSSFFTELRAPNRLNSFTDRFRNKAMHVDSLDRANLRDARAALLDAEAGLVAALVTSVR